LLRSTRVARQHRRLTPTLLKHPPARSRPGTGRARRRKPVFIERTMHSFFPTRRLRIAAATTFVLASCGGGDATSPAGPGQPAPPGQTAPPVWRDQPASLASAALAVQQKVRLAMDAQGNAIVLFISRSGGGAVTRPYVNRYDAATGQWGTPASLGGDSVDDVDLRLSVNASGQGVATWTEYDAAGIPTLWMRPLSTGSAALPPAEIIERSAAESPKRPNGVIDAAGNMTFAWAQDAGNNVTSHYVRYRSANGQWSAPALLGRGSSSLGTPSLATNGRDRTMIGWAHVTDSGQETGSFVMRYAPPASLRVDALQLGSALSLPPEIALAPDGRAVALWAQAPSLSDMRSQLYRARFDPATEKWSDAQPMEQLPPGTQSGAQSLAVDGQGHVYAAWTRLSEADFQLVNVVSRMDAATGRWETPKQLGEPAPVASFGFASIAATAGGALVVWQGPTTAGGPSRLLSMKYEPGTGWSAAAPVDPAGSAAPDGGRMPLLAANDKGFAMALWESAERLVANFLK
jgi:hypothetical protein